MAKRILITDDMATVRILIKTLLRNEGYTLEEATDGSEACLRCKDLPFPDLVLMDVMMPNVNGIEACRSIKDFNAAIKVIMVTTKGDQENINAAKIAGCDDFITKPISRMELILRIRRQIGTPSENV